MADKGNTEDFEPTEHLEADAWKALKIERQRAEKREKQPSAKPPREWSARENDTKNRAQWWR